MLDLLIQYADKCGISSEPGFKTKDIKWLLAFDPLGNYIDLVEIGDTQAKNNKGREFQKCPDLSQPEMVSGSVTKSQFLADTLDVVVLFSTEKENKKLQNIQNKHEYFLMLLEKSKSILPELEKVALSLQNPDILSQIQLRLEDKKAKSTEKVTLQIGDKILLENTNLLAWWKGYRNIQTKQVDDTRKMRCFATHDLVKPAKTHPKIGGLSSIGGSPMKDALISFDKAAFQSFGLEQSENAAVSEEAAKRYSSALEHLIKKGILYPGLEFIYWFKEKVALEDDPLSFITENEEKQELNANEKVKQLLLSIQSGIKPDLQSNYYYLFLLSGASGRIMLRDWLEGQFVSLVKNIDAWFEDLKIIARDGESYINSPKLFSIYKSIVRDPKEVKKDLLQVDQIRVLRSALNDEEIALSLLAKVLRFHTLSIIKNEGLNEIRLAIMKAYHIRKNKKEGEVNSMNVIKPEINENHPNPAYQCGRLMAVLASLQKSALGDVGAGVVQRYYASASSTPALVLGRLTRTSQYHLSKLESSDSELANYYEESIGQIWNLLSDGIPTTLTLEEQSLFALGYYQQFVILNKESKQ